MSLLSNTFKETYLGMNISTFFANYDSALFKPKIIILTQLSLVIMSLVLMLSEYFYILPYVAIVSILLTLKHIFQVMNLFRGYDHITRSIEEFYLRKIKRANSAKFSETLRKIENSDSFSSIYTNKRNFQVVLDFYGSIFETIIKQNVDKKKIDIFSKSFINFISNYLMQYPQDTYSDVITHSAKIINFATQNNIMNLELSNKVLLTLNEYMVHSADKNLTKIEYFDQFYTAYLNNSDSNIKNDVSNREMVKVELPIWFIENVVIENRKLDITLDREKIVADMIEYLGQSQYMQMNSITTFRELTRWILETELSVELAISSFESIGTYGLSNPDEFLKLEKHSKLSLLIYIYYILVIEEVDSLKVRIIKKNARKLMDLHNDKSRNFLYDIIFDYTLANVNIADLELPLKKWESVITRDIGEKWLLADKAIQDFLIFMLLKTNKNQEELANILNSYGFSGAFLRQSYLENPEIDFTKKFAKFESMFFGVNELGIVASEVLEIFTESVKILIKMNFSQKFNTIIDDNRVSKFKNEQEMRVTKNIVDSFKLFEGKEISNKTTYEYSMRLYGDFDDYEKTFEMFTKDRMVDLFTEFLVQRHITKKLLQKTIDTQVEKNLSKFFKYIELSNKSIDTLFGYKRNYFDFSDAKEFSDFDRSIKHKYHFKRGYDRLIALDSTLMRLRIIKVDINVEKVELEKFLKIRLLTVTGEGTYQYQTSAGIFVDLSRSEIEEYLNNRFRLIEAKIHYKIEFRKDSIGIAVFFK